MKKIDIFFYVTVFSILIVSCSSEETTKQEVEKAVMLEGVSVEKSELQNINFEDDDATEVENIIIDENNDISNKELIISYADEFYEYSYSDFDVKVDIDDIKKQVEKGVDNIQFTYTYDEQKVQEIVNELDAKANSTAQDATYKIEGTGDKFVYTEAKDGIKIDNESLVENIGETITQGNRNVTAEGKLTEATWTKEKLQEATDLLGEVRTSYSSSSSDRNKNLQVAVDKINNTVLYPNDVFSAIEAIGPVDSSNGYVTSKVILDGSLVDGIGGGVCQIVTTLYGAVIYSELEVVERQNHSLKVGYADYGFDATMAEGYIDFKFKNNTNYPILIQSYLDEGRKEVVVRLYGKETRDEDRTIDFYNEKVATVEPPSEYRIVEDDTMYVGEEEVKVQPSSGSRYNLYKVVYENGEQVETIKVNESYYRPVQGVKHVGTKQPEQVPTDNNVG